MGIVTSGLTSSTLRPLVAFSSLSSASTASTALITSSKRSGSQLRKCTLTQNLLCSTEAPGIDFVLQVQYFVLQIPRGPQLVLTNCKVPAFWGCNLLLVPRSWTYVISDTFSD